MHYYTQITVQLVASENHLKTVATVRVRHDEHKVTNDMKTGYCAIDLRRQITSDTQLRTRTTSC